VKLNLHVGTEKTGSSYLQKLCGRNREFLQENGLWFPDAGEYEKRLQEGTISPGNARELAQYIHSNSWTSVTSWIKERVYQAQQIGCRSLLLSNELLFVAMSNKGAVRQFQFAAAEAGVDDISGLLMIRDPIDQALSLYKHRAKNGRVDEIEEWIQKGYSLPSQLNEFLGQLERSNIQMHLRKYIKSTASLIDVFFRDWLGVDAPPVKIQSYVNQSLSLSELAVIRHIVARRPDHQRAYYSKFLAVSLDQKATDHDIEMAKAAKVENYLCRFNNIWQHLNAQLVSDGGIEVPRPRIEPVESACQYSFSEAQIEALSEAHALSATIRFSASTLIHRLGLGRLVRNAISRFRRR
jgi:hypothetical protein